MIDYERIDTLVDKLGISIKEAEAILQADKNIDRMTIKQAESDLTTEQKAVVKSMKNSDTKKKKAPTVYKFDKRKRDKDNAKVSIMETIAQALKELTDSVEIVNAGREISFAVGANEYSLTLVKHRKKKEG